MNTAMEIRSFDEYKAACMTRPADYAEFTERGFDAGWGMTHVSTHRDVGVLAESNWNVQVDDLLARYPDSFYVQSTSHWAVGWMEHLRVNMADEEAVLAVYDWYYRLQDYPVADDDDWSRREEEAIGQAWDDWGYREFQDWAIEHEIAAVTEIDEYGDRVFLDMPSIKDAAYSALRRSGVGDECRAEDYGVVMSFDRWEPDEHIVELRQRINHLRNIVVKGANK